MNKDVIRHQMAERRDALPPEEIKAAAEDLHQQVIRLLHHLGYQPGRLLHIGAYSPIRREADLSASWDSLAAWPARIYFPAVDFRSNPSALVFGALPPGLPPESFLVRGHFGIAEPPVSARLDQMPEFDLILVPGLAFDRTGGRLGWGKAYYDRLLARIAGKPVLVGVGYDFQILPGHLPLDSSDIKMDWLLTPGGFSAAAR
jgi:5-formyltetrahydrofolate cyclo-ligase